MRLKIFILYFILLRVGLSYSQYVDFYNQLKIYHYIHNYSPVYIKNNKVKSMEINENYYRKSYKYKIYFDTTGENMKYEEFNKKGKIINTIIHIESATEVKQYYSLKNTSFTLNSNSNYYSEFEKMKFSKIKEIKYLTDSSVSYYEVKRRKILLYEHNSFDNYGNDKFIRFISNEKRIDTTDVFFDFKYSDKSFVSYTYFKNVKILVSAGILNGNNRIIKENFYWIPYKDISMNNVDSIEPVKIVLYSIDQNGLIHQRISLEKNINFNPTITNSKLINLNVNSELNKNITMFRYEYYDK